MCDAFETLPAELLDIILEDLTTTDIVNLWKSSKPYLERVEPLLFGNSTYLHQSLRWACKHGDIELIRAAVARGADPKQVEVLGANKEGIQGVDWARKSHKEICADISKGEPRMVSTLGIAAARRDARTFAALLDLGANFGGFTWSEYKALKKFLFRSAGWATFERMLVDGFAPSLIEQPGIGFNVVDVIQQKMPIKILQLMLEKGADPNLMVAIPLRDPKWRLPLGSHCLVSPLSAAISLGDMVVVDLLLKHGADIHGTTTCVNVMDKTLTEKEPFTFGRPDHLPIFAAAAYMAKTGSTDMIDRCLQENVNINYLAPSQYDGDVKGRYTPVTPLSAYLNSIEQWPVKTELQPIAGIDYFLSHGASVQLTDQPYTGLWPWIPRVKRTEKDKGISIIEVLLKKWRLNMMRNKQLLATMEYLIDLGSAPNSAYDFLQQFYNDSRLHGSHSQYDKDHPYMVPQGWKLVHKLIGKLKEAQTIPFGWMISWDPYDYKSLRRFVLEATDERGKDKLLYEFFVSQCYLQRPDNYGTFERIVVDYILAEGANINAAAGPSGQPLLHEVCRYTNETYCKEEINLTLLEKYFKTRLQASMKQLCTSLVNKGADPLIQFEGRSAIAILTNGIYTANKEDTHVLVELAVALQNARDRFLKQGTSPSESWRETDK